MHLTIEFTPEEGTRLSEKANRNGSDMGQYIKDLVVQNIQPKEAINRSKESILLETINKTFPDIFWKKYKSLLRKRNKYTISEIELQELISLTDQIEVLNLERVNALIELSEHWDIDLDVLIKKLGPLNGK
jgi:hypothetical protein